MKELKWVCSGKYRNEVSSYRNRFTKTVNTFSILKHRNNGYWLVWNSPIKNKTINTFKRLKNAKIVAQLIAFG